MHDYVRKQPVLRYELGQRLLELRSGDVEAMLRAICKRDGVFWTVVEIRDRGREAVIYARWFDGHENRFGINEIDRDGELPFREWLWKGDKDWLEVHRNELDWCITSGDEIKRLA